MQKNAYFRCYTCATAVQNWHLQDVIPVGVQGRLRQFYCEHTVGAAGLTVELSVGYPPFLLS